MVDVVQRPLVSVVLPTHNRPAWLAQALISVLGGRFDDLEVIVSNNGERDDIRRLRSTIPDARVRWVDQPQDLGMLENFLAGLALARGRYVAVLHDDDWWSADFLATLIPPLERHREVVLAFADHHVVDERGEIDRAATDANTRRWGRCDLIEGLHQPFFGVVARQSVPMTGCAFRRDALPAEAITPEVGPFYDIWTSYLLAKGGRAAYFSPRRLMYYRAHAASHSGKGQLGSYVAAIRCRRIMLEDRDLRPYASLITSQLARDHVLAGAELLRQHRRGEARTHLVAAMRLRFTLKAVAGWTASWTAPSAVLARV